MTISTELVHRRPHPIRIWAALGAMALAMQMYVYARWVASEAFVATPPGSDQVPQVAQVSGIAYEIVSIGILPFVLTWFVRGIRNTGRIDAIRLLMVGWLSAYWLDPFLNFLRPMFTYNAYNFNRGCWCEFIPGWQAANGSRIAEPLLIDPPAYFYTFTATAMLALWCMRKLKATFPNVGITGMTLAGFAGVWATMGLLDIVAARIMGFDAWPIAFQSASFWAGKYYQFPIYEFVLFPSIFVASAFLLHFADDKGQTVIERGVESIGGPSWLRTAARILAFIAFCNVLNLSYTAAMGVHALYADPWPSGMPSWLADGQCGGMTGIACARP